MAQFVASFCRYDTYSKKLWEQPAVGFYLLIGSMLNLWVCILECKVLFILQEVVPVSRGEDVSQLGFFFLVLQSITFCMSSLLFDWYSNALSVCLVLVVNLPRQHLLFLLLLPSHLTYKSKVNVHSPVPHWVLCFYWKLHGFFSVFCCSLLGRANDTFRRSSDE